MTTEQPAPLPCPFCGKALAWDEKWREWQHPGGNMTDVTLSTTPRPWNTNSPDETLILGPDRQVVATTSQDEEDYQRDYDPRAGDAELIVKAVNAHAPAFAALRDAYSMLAFAFRRLTPAAEAETSSFVDRSDWSAGKSRPCSRAPGRGSDD